jgi:hypothetical protein
LNRPVKALQPKVSLVVHAVGKEGSLKRAEKQAGMDSPSLQEARKRPQQAKEV